MDEKKEYFASGPQVYKYGQTTTGVWIETCSSDAKAEKLAVYLNRKLERYEKRLREYQSKNNQNE